MKQRKRKSLNSIFDDGNGLPWTESFPRPIRAVKNLEVK